MNRQRSVTWPFNLLFPAMIGCGIATATAHGSEISTDGQKLSHRLDQTHVEELWPAGVHVSWETGEPDGRSVRTAGKHTHCSAFVAATAKHLGVYILRPPEHGPMLLANAQYDWLFDQGQSHGWYAVPDGKDAQKLANRGFLVVAAYRNHHDRKPGHIAIVRPSSKSSQDIHQSGPQIIQAGGTNYFSTTLKKGFSGHPRAWANHEIRYFAHAIEWAKLQ